jgi:Tfp pilus assembly protein PilN
MATALIPYVQIIPDERLLRIPDIRADLLPVEVEEARRARKVRTAAIAVVVAFTAVIFAWYGVARYQVGVAQDGLTKAQDDVRSLTRQQSGFTQLVSTQSQIKALNAQLSSLLADDLQWSTLLTALADAAPTGVTLTAVSGALDSAGAGGSAVGATELPSAVAYTQIGTLQVVGNAPTKPAVAAYVDSLGHVSGVANALLNGVNQTKTGVTFTIGMAITRTALGGRFATATPSAPARGK